MIYLCRSIMNSENFSYNKISLLRSLILGILVYTIGYCLPGKYHNY